jgi:hypothetical protein
MKPVVALQIFERKEKARQIGGPHCIDIRVYQIAVFSISST